MIGHLYGLTAPLRWLLIPQMLERRPLGNVLVATDFSDGARRALHRACTLPITPGSAITLVHVMPRMTPALYQAAEPSARAMLDAWAEDARGRVASTVDVFSAIELGQPFIELGRRAETERAELIVLGRHGQRAWPRGVLGSTAERVLRRGKTPVLVVAADAGAPYRRPLVAVDAEGSSLTAVELMLRLVAPEVRGALAVHVLDTAELRLIGLYEVPAQEIERFRRSREESARAAIETALDALGDTELDFELRVVEGDPRDAIPAAAQAERADLIAVGTHGRSGFRHLVLGSVAEAVLRGATVDVLVVRSRPGYGAGNHK